MKRANRKPRLKPTEEVMSCRYEITYVLDIDWIVPKGKTPIERMKNGPSRTAMDYNFKQAQAIDNSVKLDAQPGVKYIKKVTRSYFPESEAAVKFSSMQRFHD